MQKDIIRICFAGPNILEAIADCVPRPLDQYLANNISLYESLESKRIDLISQAGREIGIDLARECFEGPKWSLPEWIEERGIYVDRDTMKDKIP